MDVKAEGGFIYAIQNRDMDDRGEGCLRILSLDNPDQPQLIGSWYGLGNARQLFVRQGIAYVTGRESGLFLIDVRDGAQPRLLAQYDTVELATGLFVWGHLAFVACRQYGVEIIDVSEPDSPKHVSIVRTGEAQSVDVVDGILYAGVWGTCEVVVCDVRDPARPVILTRAPLDGRGDGVMVRDGLCYAATAHHDRGSLGQGMIQEDHPSFGRGNGMEILDVRNPAQPRTLSRIKLNERYHHHFFDTWRIAAVQGDYAFMSHTHNGCFVIDVRDPACPVIVAHARLEGPVCGLAIAAGRLYAANGQGDLTVLDASPFLMGSALSDLERCGLPAARVARIAHEPPSPFACYRVDGQVRSAAFYGDATLVAAGQAGVHVLEDGRCRLVLETQGNACGLAIRGDRLYVAEDAAGLSIWQLAETPVLLGRYRVPGSCVKQVVALSDARVMLHVGCTWMHMVDVTDAERPACLYTYMASLGLMYGRNLCDGLVAGRYAGVYWHASGLRWFDVSGADITLAGEQLGRMGIFDGITAHAGQALLVQHGGLMAIDPLNPTPPAELDKITVPGIVLKGKPVRTDRHLCLTQRVDDSIQLLSMERPETPALMGQWQTQGHPDIPAMDATRLAIPAGWQGLLYARLKDI